MVTSTLTILPSTLGIGIGHKHVPTAAGRRKIGSRSKVVTITVLHGPSRLVEVLELIGGIAAVLPSAATAILSAVHCIPS